MGFALPSGSAPFAESIRLTPIHMLPILSFAYQAGLEVPSEAGRRGRGGPKGELFEQIVEEIVDRSQHLLEMESLGEAKHVAGRIQGEIAERFRDLEKIDKVRAQELRGQMEARE